MMKNPQFKQKSIQKLMRAVSLLRSKDEALAFFVDLCTPAELDAMADRWLVVPLLRKGIPYRVIHEETGVSVSTITRVARSLTMGSGGYNLISERIDKL